ncbi:hypothetical protein D9M70_392520 [compost metagenome]
MLADQLFADQIPRLAFLVDAREVHKGDAELLGRQLGQRAALHQLVLYQIGHQWQLVALGLLLGLHGTLLVQQLGEDDLPGQTRKGGAVVHVKAPYEMDAL